MNKILLCTDGSAFAQVGYQYIAWIAQKQSIEVQILYVSHHRMEETVKTNDLSGSLGIDTYQEMLSELVEAERVIAKLNHQRAKNILENAKKFLCDQGIATDKIQLVHHTGFLVDSLTEFEKNADLIVLGKRGETADFAPEHLGSNLERIIRASNKPCLVTTRNFHPIKRVLFAYDGGASCKKAAEFIQAMPLFKELEIHLVTVSTASNIDFFKPRFETAAIEFQDSTLNLSYQMIQGDSEQAILQYIETEKIDFLIMGAYGHSRIRHLVIGSTTNQVLRQSNIPVLLLG